MVERLFLAVPRGCLQFVIVVFPDHTHLLFWIHFLLFQIRFCFIKLILSKHITLDDLFNIDFYFQIYFKLTLNEPIATKIVCFSRLLKCLRSLYGKQCGPRSDCSYRSCLFWTHTVGFYTQFVRNVRQLFAADDFNRRHFQMHFFLGGLRVKGLKHIMLILKPPFQIWMCQ